MGITHLSGLAVSGVPTMGMGGLLPFTGNWYFCDYYRGSDGNTGSADNPFKTVYRAQAAMTDGNNDVCVIVPAPLAASNANGTQRLSYANALLVDSTATTGTLNWSKSACHLIGLSGPVESSRARLSPNTSASAGLASTFLNGASAATTPMVNVTGTGCVFMNFSIWGAFYTGSAAMITWWDSGGGRNYYHGVHIAGQADAASAGGTASRTLKITTSENTFQNCVIGTDTVQRVTGTSYTVELDRNVTSQLGAARNRFMNCDFPIYLATAAAASGHIYSPGTNSLDRWTKFDNCNFLNAAAFSAGVAQTGAIKLGAATGGLMLFKNCTFLGATGTFASGDTTTSAQMKMDGGGPISNATPSSTGIPIVPYV